MALRCRAVASADLQTTRELVEIAFRPEDVPAYLDGLRQDGCLLGEWLAEDDGALVGHIAFSRVWVELEDGERLPAAILSPLAVRPDRQRSGIGQRLMAYALDVLEARGETLFFVLGHPDYYPKAGFSADLAAGIESPWSGNPAFMARGRVPAKGRLILSPAIAGDH